MTADHRPPTTLSNHHISIQPVKNIPGHASVVINYLISDISIVSDTADYTKKWFFNLQVTYIQLPKAYNSNRKMSAPVHRWRHTQAVGDIVKTCLIIAHV